MAVATHHIKDALILFHLLPHDITNSSVPSLETRDFVFTFFGCSSLLGFLSDPRPIIALSCQSVSRSVHLLSFAQIVGFVKVVTWISLSCYIDLSKLPHGFDKVFT